ncbi:MAG: alpha amylase C-terminal domain-containing protein, partial [Bacteroidales bacterium]|nr:alpha amylase C-terminal domain-containing protein [Bacteroidales bacterium]
RVIKENRIMFSMFAQQLNMDDWNKTIIFERNNLIFIFNFHTSHSIPNYEIRIPQEGNYKIILNSDSAEFGGHGRIDDSIEYPTYKKENDNSNYLKLYVTNRTALVLKKIS